MRTEPLAANNNSNLLREMGRVATAVDRQFDTLLQIPGDARRELYEAMRHAAIGGGKRMRPLLVMATASLFNVDQSCALRAATAVEALHVYSLIHDDLPCMDDDALRRGKPTTHVAFGEATAVLAGDALHALAFELLADERTHDDGSGRRKIHF
jgi:farnesyl diphosphate synthase